MTVRVVAVADQHGLLPPIPQCDVLLVAGDVCPLADHSSKAQRAFFEGPFSDWLEAAPAGEVVGIAGNHDLLAARDDELLPGLPWTYLLDGGTTAGGLEIWGTPWCPTYGDWAFMESEALLERRYAEIPDGLDVLLTHGPPLGACDRARRGVDAGSAALRDAIVRSQPAICVFGHIHEGRGRAEIGGTQCLNVSLVDARYEPRHAPVTIELERRSPDRV